MEKIKTILDRKPISSEYINSKQDFGTVLNRVENLKTPIWKSTWFYGTVGVATVAIIVAAVTLTGGNEVEQKKNSGEPQVVASQMDHDESESNTPKHQVHQPNTDKDNVEVEVKDDKPVEFEKQNSKSKQREAETYPKKEKTEVKVESVEYGMPNIAGVSSGAVSINSICRSTGLNVDGGVLIYGYTIQYRSCARDVVAKIRGNLIPPSICSEIRDCGSNIEISFLNIDGRDRNNAKVDLDDFTIVAIPK